MEDSLDSEVEEKLCQTAAGQHYIQRCSGESQSQRHTAGKFTVDQVRRLCETVDNNLATSVCEAAVYEYQVDH